MLTEKIEKALNDQFTAELYSSYLYLSMNAYFKSSGLEGFANWMYAQAQEEVTHAMKFYDFINQRGGRVILQQIDAPPAEWESPLAVFEATLKHEQKVTGLINDLVEQALHDKRVRGWGHALPGPRWQSDSSLFGSPPGARAGRDRGSEHLRSGGGSAPG